MICWWDKVSYIHPMLTMLMEDVILCNILWIVNSLCTYLTWSHYHWNCNVLGMLLYKLHFFDWCTYPVSSFLLSNMQQQLRSSSSNWWSHSAFPEKASSPLPAFGEPLRLNAVWQRALDWTSLWRQHPQLQMDGVGMWGFSEEMSLYAGLSFCLLSQ